MSGVSIAGYRSSGRERVADALPARQATTGYSTRWHGRARADRSRWRDAVREWLDHQSPVNQSRAMHFLAQVATLIPHDAPVPAIGVHSDGLITFEWRLADGGHIEFSQTPGVYAEALVERGDDVRFDLVTNLADEIEQAFRDL